jgi:hypothetical protein
LLPLAALSLLLVVSCGPSFRHIQARFVTEAEYLQAEVIAKGIKGSEVSVADGFLARAKTATNPKLAADFADIAAANYRVVLARHSLDQSANAISEAETALEVAQEQVEKYQQILTGLKTRTERRQ